MEKLITLLDAFKEKFKNTFQVKFILNKLKIMFANPNDFTDFKIICQKENIEYHLHSQLRKNNHCSAERSQNF